MRISRVSVATLILLTACGQGPGPSASTSHSTPSTPSSTASTLEPSPTIAPATIAPVAGLGGQIAYVAGLDPQIHLLDLATGVARQLTDLRPEHGELTGAGPLRPAISCGVGPSSLAWAPDGRLLAFVYGGCDTVVYLVDLDGELRRIGDGRSPAWSPDGRQLLYAANVPYSPCGPRCGPRPVAGEWDLRIVDVAEEGEVTTFLEAGATEGASGPIWSPDGTQVAYAGPPSAGAGDGVFAGAYLVSAAGGPPVFLGDGLYPLAWMPDGRLLVSEDDGLILALDLITGLTQPVGPAETRSVSPDATRVVTWTVDPETSVEQARVLTANGQHLANLPGHPMTWTADSQLLAVVDGQRGAITIVDRDGAILGGWAVDLQGTGASTPGAWRPEG